MQDPNELSDTTNPLNILDVNVASEGEELSEAEQSEISGGGNYGPPTGDDN